ncbi:DUF1667 domain-containing protein [Miniphocaeibacter halophilus]|uniref:DUF1667 domain-containing protein n=1 Tax=Miniphocaeibacter halophilus TaxID=2931922 RepID=A0AC61MTU3_9FIRM|nr:DUF1667 domain-containing protein [Miniphocaeibacter halophilus]QQK08972.1 DUF1667 domain-containing protein [Miniphocaeibacter halophilus]
MEEKNLICISCPIGCHMTVTLDNEEVSKVEGNTCKRGAAYAEKEITNPTRFVTSTVKVKNGQVERVSVKTELDIPKSKIFDVMKEINSVEVSAPVKMGDTIIENVAGTNVNIIATRSVK